jgi:hypothetical protein
MKAVRVLRKFEDISHDGLTFWNVECPRPLLIHRSNFLIREESLHLVDVVFVDELLINVRITDDEVFACQSECMVNVALDFSIYHGLIFADVFEHLYEVASYRSVEVRIILLVEYADVFKVRYGSILCRKRIAEVVFLPDYVQEVLDAVKAASGH